jgi:tRNA (guanosine-2'-O-)-methyltransferase
MTKARLDRVNQVLSQRQPDLTVILDGVHKPHNVAAILRSCDAVGILDVHIARPRCGFGKHHMTSGGTQKWMPAHYYERVSDAVETLQTRGFQVLAANKSSRATEYLQPDYTRPTAFVMGAELYGVDRQILDRVDGEVYIPMMGMVESFNVSVACAILLSEARRQRQDAGYYEQSRLPVEIQAKLRFEWLHPELALHYQSRNECYPPLDEDGDVCFGAVR